MIKQVYAHCMLLIALLSYITSFVLLGTTYDTHQTRFSFLLTLSILNILSLGVDFISITYFVNAGTAEDVYSRQHIVIVVLYTVVFALAVGLNLKYWFLAPFAVLFLSIFHRSFTHPEVHLTLADIVLFVVWLVFLIDLF